MTPTRIARRATRAAAVALAATFGAATPDAAAAAAPPPPSGAAAVCRALAAVPLRDVDGFLLSPADVGSAPLSLLVDTGSDAGLLAGPVARALGLAIDTERPATLQGTGGTARAVPVALVPRLLLGSLLVRDLPMPVGSLPEAPNVSPPVGGLVGGDLLSHFAVGIDVPDGWLLFLPDRPPCNDRPLWPGPADTLPLGAGGPRDVRRTVPVTLDGRRLTALLDTGARSEIVARRAALEAGVAAGVLDAEPGGVSAGIDRQDELYHWHRFRTLRIGRSVTRDPVLTVTRLPGSEADLLLGADWFARHRVVISYAANRMIVQAPAPAPAPVRGGR